MRSRGKQSLSTFIIGGLVGLGVGLLIAPENGRKLRRRLAYQLDNASDRVGEFIDGLNNPDVHTEAERSGAELIANAKAQANQILDDVDRLVHEAKMQHAKKPTES